MVLHGRLFAQESSESVPESIQEKDACSNITPELADYDYAMGDITLQGRRILDGTW
jgi:hypothetical protein